MPALPARKVKAMPYTFNSPVTAKVFCTQRYEAAAQISNAFSRGGIKAAVSKAREITAKTFEEKTAGDHEAIVEIAVVDSSGKFDTFR